MRTFSPRWRLLDGTVRPAPTLIRPPPGDVLGELLDRVGRVVDLEPQHDVVVQPDAAPLPHDQDRGGLPAARVAAGGVARLQRRDQAMRQVTFGPLERLYHARDHRLAREDV